MSAPVVACVVLAAAMLYEHHEALLVSSYEAEPAQWDEDDGAHCGALMMLDENRVSPIGAPHATEVVAPADEGCSR